MSLMPRHPETYPDPHCPECENCDSEMPYKTCTEEQFEELCSDHEKAGS